jgi:hypothetical protein
MTGKHVPRENDPGDYYGHPAIYIGPRGNPSGRSWAVYVADGGAHDRHTVKALVDTEEEAEEIAGLVLRSFSEGGTFSVLSTSFPPPFQYLSTSGNRRKPLKTKAETLNLFTSAGKEIYSVFLRVVIRGRVTAL